VNHWSERKEAGRIALRSEGVLAVDNRLTIRGVNYAWDEWRLKALESMPPFAKSTSSTSGTNPPPQERTKVSQ